MKIGYAWAFIALAAALTVASATTYLVEVIHKAASHHTVVWEGKTWDCTQVAQWDAHYGAYEPDGTPIPYEVVFTCMQ